MTSISEANPKIMSWILLQNDNLLNIACRLSRMRRVDENKLAAEIEEKHKLRCSYHQDQCDTLMRTASKTLKWQAEQDRLEEFNRLKLIETSHALEEANEELVRLRMVVRSNELTIDKQKEDIHAKSDQINGYYSCFEEIVEVWHQIDPSIRNDSKKSFDIISVKEFRAAVESLLGIRSKTDDHNESIMNQLHQSESKNTILEKKLESIQREFDSLTLENDQLNRQITVISEESLLLKRKHKKSTLLEKQLEENKLLIKQKESETNVNRIEMNELTSIIAEQEKKIEVEKNKINDLNHQLTEKEKERQAEKNRNNELNRLVTEKEKELKADKNGINELNHLLVEKEKELQVEKNTINDLNHVINEKEKELKAEKNKINELNHLLAEKEIELKNERDKLLDIQLQPVSISHDDISPQKGSLTSSTKVEKRRKKAKGRTAHELNGEDESEKLDDVGGGGGEDDNNDKSSVESQLALWRSRAEVLAAAMDAALSLSQAEAGRLEHIMNEWTAQASAWRKERSDILAKVDRHGSLMNNNTNTNGKPANGNLKPAPPGTANRKDQFLESLAVNHKVAVALDRELAPMHTRVSELESELFGLRTEKVVWTTEKKCLKERNEEMEKILAGSQRALRILQHLLNNERKEVKIARELLDTVRKQDTTEETLEIHGDDRDTIDSMRHTIQKGNKLLEQLRTKLYLQGLTCAELEKGLEEEKRKNAELSKLLNETISNNPQSLQQKDAPADSISSSNNRPTNPSKDDYLDDGSVVSNDPTKAGKVSSPRETATDMNEQVDNGSVNVSLNSNKFVRKHKVRPADAQMLAVYVPNGKASAAIRYAGRKVTTTSKDSSTSPAHSKGTGDPYRSPPITGRTIP